MKVGDYVITSLKYKGRITKIVNNLDGIVYTVQLCDLSDLIDASIDITMYRDINDNINWYGSSIELDVERNRDCKLKELGI
jgi:hypothetical protein